jgi:hypothetical protein
LNDNGHSNKRMQVYSSTLLRSPGRNYIKESRKDTKKNS